jgi:transposase-like protein
MGRQGVVMVRFRFSPKQWDILVQLAAVYRHDPETWLRLDIRPDSVRRLSEMDLIVESRVDGVKRYRITRRGLNLVEEYEPRPRQKYSDDEMRRAIRLFFEDGLTYDQIAAVTGMNKNTVGFAVRGETMRTARLLAEMGYEPHVGRRVVSRNMRGAVIQLRQSGNTYREISRLTRLAVPTVARICQKHVGKAFECVDDAEAERIARMVDAGMPVSQVARKVGRCWHTVKRHYRAEKLRREFLGDRGAAD